MKAIVYINGKEVQKISLPKQRKERNKQIKAICKQHELLNQPCYVDIVGADIKQ